MISISWVKLKTRVGVILVTGRIPNEPISNIRYLFSNIEYQISDMGWIQSKVFWLQVGFQWYLRSDICSDIYFPISEIRYICFPISDIRYLFSNIWYQITVIRYRMNSKKGVLVTSRIPSDLCSVLVAAPRYKISVWINCISICGVLLCKFLNQLHFPK